MKSLVLLPVLACGVIAQGPPQEPKIPRPQAVGRAEKVSEAPAAKLERPDSTAPATVREPRRTLTTKDQAIADQGRQGIKSAFDDPDFVAFDDPTDGPIWAVSQNWKASFDAQGLTFIGRPAPEATSLQPIRFHLASAKVGNRDLELQDAMPVRTNRHVELRRGSLVEAFDLGGRGAEQTFTITELPQRGQLTLDLAVDTQLAGENTGSGIVFQGPFDQIGYSAAVAIDANGNRVAAPTTFRNGHIAIEVPAAFMENAALPICIDPWIHAIQVYSLSSDLADPDIAWDENNGVWAVAFARYFGGSDWDCYVQRVAPYNPMTLVGGITVIDGTGDAWQRPRIADLKSYAEFMVVCQVHIGTNPWKIAGRIMSNQGPVNTNQFDVFSSGVDDYHPDVGGDPGGAPTYFTVVWEHAYSATDHDIYARQITNTGALRGTTPIYVQTNTQNQTWPTISKSDGAAPYASQRFTIVYQQTYVAGDEDIYGAMLTWDGVFVPVAGLNNFPIETSGYNETFPQASSPTLEVNGLRTILVVFERNINGSDICAVCMDQAGNWHASGNISVLEGDPFRLPWPQYRPSVDSDGTRFVVGYHEIYNGNTTINDNDTRVSLVALTGNALLVEEPGVQLGYSQNREFNIQVATQYGGSGVGSVRANTTNDRDNVPTGFAIDCYSYDSGPLGRFDTRSTSCGVLGISHSGTPVTGNTISFALTPSPYLSGFVVGAPASVPIAPCPGCTLGVNGSVVSGVNWSLLIPNNPAYIGWMFSVQGFVFHGAGGPCLGSIRVSDTVDVTVY